MAVTITGSLNERGSGTISVALTDEAGAALTPKTCTWSLYDKATGAAVNSLTDQAVTGVLGSTVYIVLAAADLQIMDETKETEMRVLTLSGTYDTTINGVAHDDHPFKLEGVFRLANLVGATTPAA